MHIHTCMYMYFDGNPLPSGQSDLALCLSDYIIALSRQLNSHIILSQGEVIAYWA